MPITPLEVRGDVDPRAVEQLARCAEAGDAVRAALLADGHVGYSQPIGGVIAYPEHISPSAVGYDIACIAEGTPVTTVDGFWRPTEEIAAADAVACWNTTRIRRALPVEGAIGRGVQPTVTVRLDGGREIRATADHRVRTKLGWTEAGDLRPGDGVACSSFIGLPHARHGALLDFGLPEPPRRFLVDRATELTARGLWPVDPDGPLFPAVLRVLAYLAGDGNLSPSG